jgi:hypothetical protein
MQSCLTMHPMSVTVFYNGLLHSAYSSYNLPSAGGQCISVNMLTLHLSFHTTAVKSSFTLVIMSSCFSLSFFPKLLDVPFQFALTVPQKCIAYLCKMSNTFGEEKKLSTYSLCTKFSILVPSPAKLHELQPLQQIHISCLCLNICQTSCLSG